MASFDLKKLKIKPSHIIEFPQGLIGFSSAKRFVLIDESSSKRFLWLASVDRPELSFLVIDPRTVVENYEIEVEQKDLDFLDLASLREAEIFSVVTIPHNIGNATANLRSPILINTKSKLGKQVILEQGRYSIQHTLLRERAPAKAVSVT